MVASAVNRFETRYESEDDKPVISCGLIPQYCLTEEYKKQIKERDEKEVKRVLWFMQQAEEEEQEEARAKKRRAKKATGKKKSAKK